MCVNPPYGVRLEDHEGRASHPSRAGRNPAHAFPGLDTPPSSRLRISASSSASAPTAPTPCGTARIECRLLRLNIEADAFRERDHRPRRRPRRPVAQRVSTGAKNVRQPPRQEPEATASAGCATPASPAIASTTPTCPSTPSPSTRIASRRRGRRQRRERRSLAARPGVRRPREHRRRIRAPPPRRSVLRAARSHRRARRAHPRAHAQAADARQPVSEGRRAVPLPHRGRRRPEAARELRRLPRHRPVPGPSPHARAHPRDRRGQALPESLLLHGHSHGVRRGGRRALQHLRRPVAHLSRLGRAQPRPEWPRDARSPARPGRLPRVAASEARVDSTATSTT